MPVPVCQIRHDVGANRYRLVEIPQHQHRVDFGHLPLPEFPLLAVARLLARLRHQFEERGEFLAPPPKRLERQHEQLGVVRAPEEAVVDVLVTLVLLRLYSCNN